MSSPTPELIRSMKDRLGVTYALNEEQKKAVLSRMDALSAEQIEQIFLIVEDFERKIERDFWGYSETQEQQSEKRTIEDLLDAFPS